MSQGKFEKLLLESSKSELLLTKVQDLFDQVPNQIFKDNNAGAFLESIFEALIQKALKENNLEKFKQYIDRAADYSELWLLKLGLFTELFDEQTYPRIKGQIEQYAEVLLSKVKAENLEHYDEALTAMLHLSAQTAERSVFYTVLSLVSNVANNYKGENILHSAAIGGDPDIMCEVCDRLKSQSCQPQGNYLKKLLNELDSCSRTPLAWAIEAQHYDCFAILYGFNAGVSEHPSGQSIDILIQYHLNTVSIMYQNAYESKLKLQRQQINTSILMRHTGVTVLNAAELNSIVRQINNQNRLLEKLEQRAETLNKMSKLLCDECHISPLYTDYLNRPRSAAPAA